MNLLENAPERVGIVPLVAVALLLGGLIVLAGGRLRDGPRAPDTAADSIGGAARVDGRTGARGPVGPTRPVTPPPADAPLRYTVAPGDTLSLIAARAGTTVESLLALNGLRDPDAIVVGQSLALRAAPARAGPALRVLPDSELVYGPAYLDFDLDAVLAAYPQSELVGYTERVEGRLMTGPDIVRAIARDFSVGPRVLLAVLEGRGGWVTGPAASETARRYPAGLVDPAREGLWRQLNWLADRLNSGYYDWKTRGARVLTLGDGRPLLGHPALGPGGFALQRALALQGGEDDLMARLTAVEDAYRALFGDPWSRALPPLDLAAVRFPALRLPWPDDERWWMTGGPHGGWADGSAWAALDFVPDEAGRGCFVSAHEAVAVADGVVLDGGQGQLWLDLDGDGRRATGPVVLYLHLAAEGRAPAGTRVRAGDPLGRPSCEGGTSNATHLHLARLYDGEWLAAAGEVPFVLGGWRATAEGAARVYDGALVHEDGRVREACECREVGYNDVGR